MTNRILLGVFAGALVLFGGTVARAIDLLDSVTARAAIVVDHATGDILFERNPDLQLPPASTTKVLTAYLALQSERLYETVPVSAYASSMEPSKIGLRAGWEMNVNDLVYATLLNSANDATVVIAEGLAGSVPAFSQQMNDTAVAMGAVNSNFVNPNGLPAVNHYSTVRDLTRIFHYSMQLPQFREILTVPSTVVLPAAGSRRPIQLRSHNRLLGHEAVQVIGKTGYTRAAKKCFVGAATVDGKEVLVAVLGSTNLWGDLRRLIDFGLNRGNMDDFRPYLSNEVQLTKVNATQSKRSAGKRGTRKAVVREAVARPTTSRFQLHLGNFRTKSEASELRKKVAVHGYNVVVKTLGSGRSQKYRVTAQGFQSQTDARQAAKALRRVYRIEPQVVAVGA